MVPDACSFEGYQIESDKGLSATAVSRSWETPAVVSAKQGAAAKIRAKEMQNFMPWLHARTKR